MLTYQETFVESLSPLLLNYPMGGPLVGSEVANTLLDLASLTIIRGRTDRLARGCHYHSYLLFPLDTLDNAGHLYGIKQQEAQVIEEWET